MRPLVLSHLTCTLALAACAAPAVAAPSPTPAIVFPSVGMITQWHDDFGESRPIGHEQGNDVGLLPHTPLVAAEAGTIEKLWWGGGGWAIRLTQPDGDQFMYLHMGQNGHPELAYVPGLANGAHVAQGQQIGWSGFSGNASKAFPHCEFQYLPHGGSPIDPYRLLIVAPHLLFVAPASARKAAGSPAQPQVTLQVRGTVSWAASGDSGSLLRVLVARARLQGGAWNAVARPLTLTVDPAATFARNGATVSFAALRPGDGVTVWTTAFVPTLKAEMGESETMQAARIVAASAH